MLDKYRIIYDNKNKFVVKISKDFCTHKGVIKKEQLEKEAGTVKTNKGAEYQIIKPNLSDIYQIIKRKPQIILQKDMGAIITYCGINKNTTILEAGTGSGASAIVLGSIAKKVISYDIREDHLKQAKENIDLFEMQNIELKKKDIYQGIDENNIDVILLDLAEPWLALEHAKNALKLFGFIVTYSPNITQISETVEKAKELNLEIKGIKEINEKNWKINGRIVRPINRENLTHTAFLAFFRKIDNSKINKTVSSTIKE